MSILCKNDMNKIWLFPEFFDLLYFYYMAHRNKNPSNYLSHACPQLNQPRDIFANMTDNNDKFCLVCIERVKCLNWLSFSWNDSFRFGIEGPVYLTERKEKGGEWFVDDEQQKVRKVDGSVCYSVLQTVAVHLEVVEPQPNRPKLQLTLI